MRRIIDNEKSETTLAVLVCMAVGGVVWLVWRAM